MRTIAMDADAPACLAHDGRTTDSLDSQSANASAMSYADCDPPRRNDDVSN